MTQTVELKVAMSCGGCSGAVNRVLSKMEGVESFEINMKEQKVTVIGNVEREAVFQTVSKTGKKTAFWEEEAPPPAAAPAETKPAETEAAVEVAPAPETKAAEPETVTATAPETKPAEPETVTTA